MGEWVIREQRGDLANRGFGHIQCKLGVLTKIDGKQNIVTPSESQAKIHVDNRAVMPYIRRNFFTLTNSASVLMKKIIAGSVALVAIVLAAAYVFSPGAEDLSSVTIAISGMSSPAAVDKITGLLQGLEGVATAEVSYKEARARVQYDPTLITVAAMESEISKLGFGTANFEAQSCAPEEKAAATEKAAGADCCAPPAKRSDT